MKEYQRQKAIEEVQKNIKELKELKTKYEELEIQKQNPAVVAYFKLLEDIALIEEKYKFSQKTKEEIIKETFGSVCNKQNCLHPIWIYESSEYLKPSQNYEYDEEEYDDNEHKKEYTEEEYDEFIEKLSENCETDDDHSPIEFVKNYYTCLECGLRADIFAWKEFEKKHFILKNQHKFINSSYYINLYYQLLYTNTVEEAQKIVIEEFEKNKQDSKPKVRKKER